MHQLRALRSLVSRIPEHRDRFSEYIRTCTPPILTDNHIVAVMYSRDSNLNRTVRDEKASRKRIVYSATLFTMFHFAQQSSVTHQRLASLHLRQTGSKLVFTNGGKLELSLRVFNKRLTASFGPPDSPNNVISVPNHPDSVRRRVVTFEVSVSSDAMTSDWNVGAAATDAARQDSNKRTADSITSRTSRTRVEVLQAGGQVGGRGGRGRQRTARQLETWLLNDSSGSMIASDS